jgi:structural hemagglutinin/hemolysin toxin protein RtxA
VYTFCFYVPETALEQVKAAVFAAGAGRIGNYDHCCWQVAGQGQFRPLAGSNPAIGRRGEIETVMEYRVEMVCEAGCIAAAVAAMKAAHPYEEPAWHVLEMVTELPP